MAGDEGINRQLSKLKNRLDVSFNEMEERISKGEMQLFTFPSGLIVTEIKQLPAERVMHVVWLNGKDFDDWKAKAFSELKSLALGYGCKAIEAHCRPGLAESLRTLGFRTIKKTVRVEL